VRRSWSRRRTSGDQRGGDAVLRYLGPLERDRERNKVDIVFPFPIDILKAFKLWGANPVCAAEAIASGREKRDSTRPMFSCCSHCHGRPTNLCARLSRRRVWPRCCITHAAWRHRAFPPRGYSSPPLALTTWYPECARPPGRPDARPPPNRQPPATAQCAADPSLSTLAQASPTSVAVDAAGDEDVFLHLAVFPSPAAGGEIDVASARRISAAG